MNIPAGGNSQKPKVEIEEKVIEINSASIKNAHATGDGAVQKSDELPLDEEKGKTTNDTETY